MNVFEQSHSNIISTKKVSWKIFTWRVVHLNNLYWSLGSYHHFHWVDFGNIPYKIQRSTHFLIPTSFFKCWQLTNIRNWFFPKYASKNEIFKIYIYWFPTNTQNDISFPWSYNHTGKKENNLKVSYLRNFKAVYRMLVLPQC